MSNLYNSSIADRLSLLRIPSVQNKLPSAGACPKAEGAEVAQVSTGGSHSPTQRYSSTTRYLKEMKDTKVGIFFFVTLCNI